MGLAAGRLVRDIKILWNIRCAGLGPEDAPLSTRLLIKLLSILSVRPDAIIYNSFAGRDAYTEAGYRPRSSTVIANGFDLREWRPDVLRRSEFRAEINVSDEHFLVGMIARYHPIKKHSVFLSAARKVLLVEPNTRFVLAGAGVTADNVLLTREIEYYGLRKHIIMIGPRTDISRIMASLDCLVSTSSSEGFPNVIGEAMACGVPCVATSAGDSGIIIGDTGAIVAIGDAEAIAAGVIEIFATGHDERLERARRCRARIASNFSVDRIADNYAKLYRELNGNRKN
jgi:glycosyltransferase involved in cell wall biosynthesis